MEEVFVSVRDFINKVSLIRPGFVLSGVDSARFFCDFVVDLFSFASDEHVIEPSLFVFANRAISLKPFLDDVVRNQSSLDFLASVCNRDSGLLRRMIVFVSSSIQKWFELSESFFFEGNGHLASLPFSDNASFLFCFVKEFHPRKLRLKHPVNEVQLHYQHSRSNDDLLSYDLKDPISGDRHFEKGDSAQFPASGITISDGHHRVYELYRRFLNGALDGDTVVKLRRVKNGSVVVGYGF